METLNYTNEICQVENPLDWDGHKSDLMTKACREMASFHYEHCPSIRFLYDRYDFDPQELQTEADIARIPALGVTAMKYNLLTSLPHEKAKLKLTSSGTKGMKTQIWFDEHGLARVQRMLDVLWEQEGLVSEAKTNFVMFSYDPKHAPDLGTAFTKKNQMRFAPNHGEVVYALQKTASGEWEFDKARVIDAFERFSREPSPVRIHGMPAFIFEVLEELTRLNKIIRLPESSYVFTGGGWKKSEDKQITRREFRAMLGRILGIEDANVRDGFGMAEHSAPYIECREHRFHVPAYNRVFARDPRDLAVMDPGETGLLEFVSPYNEMMPNLAILSTDLGYIDTDPCECGHNSPTFTLVGRGGLQKHKGCAITAAEAVRRR